MKGVEGTDDYIQEEKVDVDMYESAKEEDEDQNEIVDGFSGNGSSSSYSTPRNSPSKQSPSTERIKVAVRVRPPFEDEILKEGVTNIVSTDRKTQRISLKKEYEIKHFQFDFVFDENASQSEVFEQLAKPSVDDMFLGYYGTIFVYGQTGTGKTHTLSCSAPGNEGIIQRSMIYLFQKIKDDSEYDYSVRMSYVQIYMEKIQDLLHADLDTNIHIREDPEIGVYLHGIQEYVVRTPKEGLYYYGVGDENRTTALTKMNASSSRSHACLIITLERSKKLKAEDIFNDKPLEQRHTTRGKLYLVDLAGSERLKKTEAQGIRREEAKSINLSLTTLGIVVNTLAKGKGYAPFRDSKLTRLLQESLGGHGKTRIIVTVGPSSEHLQETLGTLQFGQRAMKVTTIAKIFKNIDYKAVNIKLQTQIDTLEVQKTEMEQRIEELLTSHEKLEQEYREFEKKFQTLSTDFERVGSKNKENEDKCNEMEKIISDLTKEKERREERMAKLEKMNNSENGGEFNEEKLQEIKMEYEHQLHQLSESLDDKEYELERVRKKLREKLKEIEGISAKERSIENYQEMEERLVKKEVLMKEREREMGEKEGELKKIEDLLKKKEKEISLEVSTLNEKQRELEVREREVSRQYQRSIEEKKHLDEYRESLSQMKNWLKSREKEVDSLRENLQEEINIHEEEIHKKIDEIENYKEFVEEKERNLIAERDKFLCDKKEHQKEIQQRISEMDSKQEDIEAKLFEIKNKEQELKKKEQNLFELSSSLSSRDAKLKKSEEELRSREEEFLRKQKEFLALEQKESKERLYLEQLQEILNFKEKEINGKEQLLEEQIKSRERTFDQAEKEVKQLQESLQEEARGLRKREKDLELKERTYGKIEEYSDKLGCLLSSIKEMEKEFKSNNPAFDIILNIFSSGNEKEIFDRLNEEFLDIEEDFLNELPDIRYKENDLKSILGEITHSIELCSNCGLLDIGGNNSEYSNWIVQKYREVVRKNAVVDVQKICKSVENNTRNETRKYRLDSYHGKTLQYLKKLYENSRQFPSEKDIISSHSDDNHICSHVERIFDNVKRQFETFTRYIRTSEGILAVQRLLFAAKQMERERNIRLKEAEEKKKLLIMLLERKYDIQCFQYALVECSSQLSQVSKSYTEYKRYLDEEKIKREDDQRRQKALKVIEKCVRSKKEFQRRAKEEKLKQSYIQKTMELDKFKQQFDIDSARTGYLLIQKSYDEMQQMFRLWYHYFISDENHHKHLKKQRVMEEASIEDSPPVFKQLLSRRVNSSSLLPSSPIFTLNSSPNIHTPPTKGGTLSSTRRHLDLSPNLSSPKSPFMKSKSQRVFSSKEQYGGQTEVNGKKSFFGNIRAAEISRRK